MVKREYVLLGCILFLAGILLCYRLGELLFFIGDAGWFYLSARDMLQGGSIPLVGIPSSHPWLHQGPLWTYLLAAGLLFSNFHPLAGGVIAVLFGLGSVLLMYLLGRAMFSAPVGLLAALLMATSPLVIMHARMPYHTAPIPFFTLLFLFAVYRFVTGRKYGFPLALFSLSILYNLELATVTYVFAFFLLVLFGIRQKMLWMTQLKDLQLLGISFLAGVLPMLPVFLYDTQHGFPQTLGFAAWIGYKILTVFGFPSLHPGQETTSFMTLGAFSTEYVRRLLFLPSSVIAVAIFLGSSAFFGLTVYRGVKRAKGGDRVSYVLLGWFFLTGIVGFLATKTASEAYLPLLFPSIILVESLCFTFLFRRPSTRIITGIFVFFLISANIFFLLRQQYFMGVPGGYGPTFTERMRAAQFIVNAAGKNSYTIQGVGPGSQFSSFTMNYAYLTWWLGHGPSATGRKIFILSESPTKVTVREKQ